MSRAQLVVVYCNIGIINKRKQTSVRSQYLVLSMCCDVVRLCLLSILLALHIHFNFLGIL